MNLCKEITLLLTVLLLIYIEYGASKPTFGNEYVHIKVHVPKEVTVQHDNVDETSFHHSPPPAHKIIHHYHRRGRRPSSKKVESSKHNHHHDHHHDHHDHYQHRDHHHDSAPDAFLGNIILSELKTSINSDHLEYLHHADDITNHLARPKIKYVPKKKVNTYTIIEETKKIPKKIEPQIETVKIIETKVPPKRIETYKIIESKEPTYKPRENTETIKVVNSVAEDHRDHHSHYERRKPQIETVKIIESKIPEHDHGHSYHNHGHSYHDHDHDHDHYNYKPRPRPLDEYEEHNGDGGSSSYYPKKSSSYYNRQHYDGDDYNSGADERPKHKYQHHQYTHYNDDRGYQQSGATFSHNKNYESYGPPAPSKVRDHHHGQDSSYNSYLPPSENDHHIPVDSYLPPRENDHLPIDSYLPQNSYNFNSNVKQNTLYDDEVFGGHGDGSGNISDAVDWPHSERESYTGIDSYTAKHVQGVGSGVYKYPSPYP